MTRAEKLAEQNARYRLAAIRRARERDARNDAAGLCRRCGKHPRSNGTTSCTPCRAKDRAAQVKRGWSHRTPAAVIDFCTECAACNFHRADCPNAPRTP